MFATIYLATFLTVMVLQRRSFNPVSSVHPVKWNFARPSKAYRTRSVHPTRQTEVYRTSLGRSLITYLLGREQMLDLNYVRENLDKVRAALQSRNFDLTTLDAFANADAERRRVIAESDQLNAQRNA